MVISLKLLNEFCERLEDLNIHTQQTIDRLELQKNKLAANTNVEHIILQLKKTIVQLNDQLLKIKKFKQSIYRILHLYIQAENNIKNNIEGEADISKETYVNGSNIVLDTAIDFNMR